MYPLSSPWRALRRPLQALALASAAGLLAGCGGGSATQDTVDRRTQLAIHACDLPIADARAVCGSLSVPENRERADSRLIRLPFAVLPAQAASPQPDPVVILGGGPGSSSLMALAGLPAEVLAAHPLRQRRALIAMDQRGTALTGPGSLDCPELARDYAAGERFAHEDEVSAAATACRTRLQHEGVDLAAYDSRHSARDLEELRLLLGRRLGFSRWNLAATSYGTRLALTLLAQSGEGVRSVLLDGPLPPEVNALHQAGVLEALDAVLADCEADQACGAAFPQLRQRFAARIEQLERLPGQLADGTPIRGHRVLNVMRAALAAGVTAPLPWAMEQVARGDLAGADELLGLGGWMELVPSSSGMYLSVMCRDEAGHPASGDRVPTQGAGWPDAVRVAAARHETHPLATRICPAWTAGQTLHAVPAPTRTAVPLLVTVGQFDPLTPPSNAQRVLAAMPQARVVTLAGRGHGLLESDACALQLAADFIDQPGVAPDTGCALLPPPGVALTR